MNASAERAAVLATLDDAVHECIDDLTELASVDSTNTWLQGRTLPLPGRCAVVMADEQRAGRGRHGKRWASPRGAGLYLSLAYTFETKPQQLAPVALVAGIAVLNALQRIGARHLALKWPNDIFANDAKLGGILVDTASSQREYVSVVCGIGINLDLSTMPAEQRANFDTAVTDLKSIGNALPDRATLVAAILANTISALRRFDAQGLAPFRTAWQKNDWLYGKAIAVELPGETFGGTAQGIDEQGALCVATETGTRRVSSGTVRLKAASA